MSTRIRACVGAAVTAGKVLNRRLAGQLRRWVIVALMVGTLATISTAAFAIPAEASYLPPGGEGGGSSSAPPPPTPTPTPTPGRRLKQLGEYEDPHDCNAAADAIKKSYKDVDAFCQYDPTSDTWVLWMWVPSEQGYPPPEEPLPGSHQPAPPQTGHQPQPLPISIPLPIPSWEGCSASLSALLTPSPTHNCFLHSLATSLSRGVIRNCAGTALLGDARASVRTVGDLVNGRRQLVVLDPMGAHKTPDVRRRCFGTANARPSRKVQRPSRQASAGESASGRW